MSRPWVPWLLAAFLVTVVWAFIDNIRDRDWFVAGCFGVMALGLITQLIGLYRIRRGTDRGPAEGPGAGRDRHHRP